MRSRRSKAAAILVGLALFGPAIGHAGDREAASPPASGVSSIRIDNFGRINPAYFRGAEPDDDEYARLATLGIKTVVDLRSDDVDAGDKVLAERAGMKYERIPMTTHQAPTPSIVKSFLTIVNDPVNQPVYVHCVGGRHRTGVMTAVYRMHHDGWTAEQAFKEMKLYKFGADFLHPELKKFVYGYHPAPTAAQRAESSRTAAEAPRQTSVAFGRPHPPARR